MESPRPTPVQKATDPLGSWYAHLQSERRDLPFVCMQLELFVACPHSADPSPDIWQDVGACIDKASHVHKLRQHLVYCLSHGFDGERPADCIMVKLIIIIFAGDSADVESMPASSTYRMPQTALCAHVFGSGFTSTQSSSR